MAEPRFPRTKKIPPEADQGSGRTRGTGRTAPPAAGSSPRPQPDAAAATAVPGRAPWRERQDRAPERDAGAPEELGQLVTDVLAQADEARLRLSTLSDAIDSIADRLGVPLGASDEAPQPKEEPAAPTDRRGAPGESAAARPFQRTARARVQPAPWRRSRQDAAPDPQSPDE